MDFDVFISYSSKDMDTADTICEYLESRGISCWYADRDIPAGQDWAESIVKALDRAKIFLLIFTDNANNSRQVMREVDTAVNRGIPIIPFKLTKNAPSGGMKYYLSTVHWLDAVEVEPEDSLRSLRGLITRLLSGEQPEPTRSKAPAQQRPVQKQSAPAAATQQRPAQTRKKDNSSSALVKTAVVMGIAVILALGVLLGVNLTLKQSRQSRPEAITTPAASATATPAATASPSPTPTPTPEPTPTPTQTPSPSPTPTPTPSPTPTATPAPTPSPTAAPEPIPTPESETDSDDNRPDGSGDASEPEVPSTPGDTEITVIPSGNGT